MKIYKGYKYFILFVDDYSRMMIVIFSREKYDAFQMFKWDLAKVEFFFCKSFKCLRSDRGEEFTSNEFNFFFNDRGIKR